MQERHDIADKLDRLFTTVRRADGREHSNREVARFVAAQTGHKCSSTFIKWLRTGQATNPRSSVIIALAKFFDVDPAYFLTSEDREDDTRRIEQAAADRDAALPSILLRASELDLEERRYLLHTIDMLKRRRSE